MVFCRMAQQGVQLCCSICLDLLKDPVSVPCGHNYCSSCIEAYWNQEDQIDTFSCPQCTERFFPRPVLKKNTLLAEVVEILKTTGLQAVPPDHDYAGPGDVACDSCTGRKLKAVKTCLQCLVSYCDTHLQPHYQSPAFKIHKLVKAARKLQDNICSCHDEVKKVFCRTDQQCICYLCCMDKHKGHDTISAAAERTERQKEFSTSQQNIQERIQEREKDVKLLHQQVESINHSADKAVVDSDTIFIELIASIENKQSEVRKLIRDQQKLEVSRAEELTKVVEQEVTELRRRHAELEQISHTTDHNHFLHSSTSLSRISESTHPVSSNVRPLRYFDDVTVAASKMADKLEKILKEEGTNISETLNRVGVLSTLPIPKTRAEFLQYLCPITLDPNTSHRRLSLSKGNRKVTWMRQQQSYPPHPERFTQWSQVMSREGLTGCCYWEVEWSGYIVDISVSYKDTSETVGYDCIFGYNDTSWCLKFCNGAGGCVFRHSGIETKIPGPVSSRVGVYLDHSAGTLSFYSVSDTTTLLYRVQTTFTHTLYAGFGLYGGLLGTTRFAAAELCDIK